VINNHYDNRIFPCRDCGKMRSAAEGGDIFTVCDGCWDSTIAQKKPAPVDALPLVAEFHRVYGQPIHDQPHIDDSDLNTLRFKLIAEELAELGVALAERDAVEVLDALVDLQYVLDGAFLSLGFHRMKAEALAEVHRSNLSKLGEDGKPVLRADGKVIKGPAFSPPDLASIVKRHGEGK
jgi:predicted HAD superfamily Cof-like phosphohydrolase